MKKRFSACFQAFPALGIATAIIFAAGCVSRPGGHLDGMAIRYGKVSNPSDIEVRVSLNNRAVYVYENEEPRFVAAVAIGTKANPTPTGNFRAFNKLPRKRSNTYGFWVKGEEIIPGRRTSMPYGYRYVGYPMPYWVEFKSGYGFHAGAVWPQPRTKGCLRLHRSIASDFFHLVKPGTPIHIANSLPEDSVLGKKVPRPIDYDLPDSPRSVLITDAPFDSVNVLF
tara:strand:+ start:4766 stop:5440 length:675 start_codon:yes stop_codon:yes gene_type:complete